MRHRLKVSRTEGSPEFLLELDDSVPTEQQIFEYLGRGCPYEPDVTSFFYRVLHPGDIVLDVGANVGWFTVLAASIVGPNGQVLAFEAAPQNVQRICRQVEVNRYDQVTVVEAALSEHTAAAKFYLNPKGNGGHALWKSEEGSECIDLITRRLDEFAYRLKSTPRLIKIDVEGAEECVLRGARSFLGQVPFIVTELHTQGLEAQNSSQLSMRALMYEYGYEAFVLAHDGDLPMFLPRGTELLTSWVQNILFAKPDAVGELWPQFACGMGIRYPEKEANDASTKHT